MKKTTPLLQQAEAFVFTLMRDRLPSHYLFHDFNHAADVAAAVAELGEAEQLDREVAEQMQLAAWFLYTGNAAPPDERTAAGIRYATTFLQEQKAPAQYIDRVSELLAAASKKAPATPLEAILHDARHAWMARKNLMQSLERWFMQERLGGSMADSFPDWLRQQQDALLHFRYHTLHGARRWQRKKNARMSRLFRMLQGEEQLLTGDKSRTPNVEHAPLKARPLHVDENALRGLERTAALLFLSALLLVAAAVALRLLAKTEPSLGVVGLLVGAGGIGCLLSAAMALWPALPKSATLPKRHAVKRRAVQAALWLLVLTATMSLLLTLLWPLR